MVNTILLYDQYYNTISSLLIIPNMMTIPGKYFMTCSVADLEGVPRVPWNPPFGFSCARKFKVMEAWPSAKPNYLDCNH